LRHAATADIDAQTMERSVRMPLGVVIERREIDHRWQKWRWTPLAVIPGAPPVDKWQELMRGDRFVRWHAATLPLELHRTETEAYRVNLSGRSPAIYVVLRKVEPSARTAGYDIGPFALTASPYDAEGYMGGDDLVEAVPMPEGLMAWVQAFVDRHHVDQPFVKRKRERANLEDGGTEGQAGAFVGPRVRQRGSRG
jgi:Protein of unknown function (DUF3305)